MIRSDIVTAVREYYQTITRDQPFRPGIDPIPCSGKLLGVEELSNLVEASLDLWLTTGRFAAEFESKLAKRCGVRYASFVNSGSSANLAAISALTSPSSGWIPLKPGDEVITPALGFPTTVAPIVQNGLVPVFIDVNLRTLNLEAYQLHCALTPRTRAIVAAHTLGNPFDLGTVSTFAHAHGLALIEDCCDALGAQFNNRPVGTFGDMATLSFYPAHHITTGEGGAVLTNSPTWHKIVESFRDWGRDCWCDPGKDNTCGRRFSQQHGELPCGYDHKYTYSHAGYNLKATDMQAAIGVAQLVKLDAFLERRLHNFNRLYQGIEHLEEFFMLPEPTLNSDPAWFGFPITVRKSAPFSRDHLVRHLESRKIATRPVFAGNLTRQPAFQSTNMRVVGCYNADIIMKNSLWAGIYPGITDTMIDYMIESFCEIAKETI